MTKKEFRILSLAEADTEYSALEAKLAELFATEGETKRELAEVEADLVANPTPRVNPAVAELLGDSVDRAILERPTKVRSLRDRLSHVAIAIDMVRTKLRDRRGIASVAACAAVKAEYGKRIETLVDALHAAQAARLHADALLDDLEAQDIEIARMPALRPYFLGDKIDGPVHRFEREAREAGYVR